MTGKYGNRSFSRIKISPPSTGNNAYIVWFTDKGTLDSNCELIFKGWWERNQTAEEPVVRLSSDNGATFGVK